MAYLIGNARIDENGKAYGGTAGDQTGAEVRIQNWYSYPWNCIIRPHSATVAEKMASTMEILCKGNLVGYDQYQRTTLFTELQKVGWDASKLTTKCETDCSAMVAVCANAAGVAVSKDIWTGIMVSAFKATGQFDVLYDSKYLTSGDYLVRGDILLNEAHHTAIALTTGSKAEVPRVYTEGWVHDDKGWWYQHADGTYPAGAWEEIGGKWYYFETDGYMASDKWVYGATSPYYLGSDGAMVTDMALRIDGTGKVVPVQI